MAATDVDICNLALDNLGVTQKIASLAATTREAQACNRWYAQSRDAVLQALPWRFARKIGHLAQYGTARATVTFQDSVAAGGTIVVNGTTFTAVSSNPGFYQFLTATPKAVTAQHFAAAVNVAMTTVRAVVVNDVVTLYAATAGDEGNAYTLTETSPQISVSGSTFTGGVDTPLHEWAYAFVLPTDFLVGHRVVSGNRKESGFDRVPYQLGLGEDGTTKLIFTDFVDTDGSLPFEYTAQITTVSLYPPQFIDALSWGLAARLAMPLVVKPDLAMFAAKMYKALCDTAYVVEVGAEVPDQPPEGSLITARL